MTIITLDDLSKAIAHRVGIDIRFLHLKGPHRCFPKNTVKNASLMSVR